MTNDELLVAELVPDWIFLREAADLSAHEPPGRLARQTAQCVGRCAREMARACLDHWIRTGSDPDPVLDRLPDVRPDTTPGRMLRAMARQAIDLGEALLDGDVPMAKLNWGCLRTAAKAVRFELKELAEGRGKEDDHDG